WSCPALEPWLPTHAGSRLSSVVATGRGPFTNLTYAFEAVGQTTTNRWLNATDVELKAQGFGRTIREASVIAKAKDSTASMKFSGIAGGATNQVRVEELRFSRGTMELL